MQLQQYHFFVISSVVGARRLLALESAVFVVDVRGEQTFSNGLIP